MLFIQTAKWVTPAWGPKNYGGLGPRAH